MCFGSEPRRKQGTTCRGFSHSRHLRSAVSWFSCKVEVRITGRDERGVAVVSQSDVSCVGHSQKTQCLHPPTGFWGATYRVSTAGGEVLARVTKTRHETTGVFASWGSRKK